MIIKIFISIIFIAELIIAFALIFNMLKIIKSVELINEQLNPRRDEVVEMIRNFRLSLKDFVVSFKELMVEFKKKREDYVMDMIKNLMIYSLIFLMRGKYKKALLAYALIKEMHDGFEESCG